MADFSLKQGEDKKVLLLVKKDGVNVDVSNASKIQAKLLIAGVEAKKYADTEETDYGTLEVDSVNNYQVNLFIERADSKSFALGRMSVALLIDFIDTDFPDGTRTEEFAFNIGTVRKGEGTDLAIE